MGRKVTQQKEYYRYSRILLSLQRGFDIIGVEEIKGDSMIINNTNVPEPVRNIIELVWNQKYYTPDFVYDDCLCRTWHWDGEKRSEFYLRNGLIHLTEEAALVHAKALLSLSKR